MRVLFIEKTADGLLDLAVRAQAFGHSAIYHLVTYDQYKCPVGRGLVPRCPDWRTEMNKVDLVVVGGNDYAQREFDMWRQRGVKIVGSSVEAETWESDRSKGMAVLRAAGIPVPPYRAFNNYDAAIAYIKKQDRPFVSKPSGHCDDKALTYVAKSPADLVYMLERWKRAGKRIGQEFILQEKIEGGVEVSAGAWFGPNGFVESWETSFEHKKLFAGDLGPNTGEMGTVSFWSAKSKLADKVLKPLEVFLHRSGFIGCINVNCLIDEDGFVAPLEFTSRCGWPAFNLECAAFTCDPIEFLHDLALGKQTKGVHQLDEVVVGVVVALPDFPYSHATRKEVVGVPIYGITPRLQPHCHFAQVAMGDAPQEGPNGIHNGPLHVTAGDYVMIITGTGDTVTRARSAAYSHVKQLSMPASPFHRIDIGVRLRKDLDSLQTHGYASGMVY